MGKKIFVSYKYADSLVQNFPLLYNTTARDYVNKLSEKLGDDNIYKGEDDGEDMSSLADATIASKLGDKIFDSSITIVLISKGMDNGKPEREQWIPWEISYSLKEQSRSGRKSKTNGVLAVVLPDETGSYSYFVEQGNCPNCNNKIIKTTSLFPILRKNMFNIKSEFAIFSKCKSHDGRLPYLGHPSLIPNVTWDDFIDDVNKYISLMDSHMEDFHKYEVFKTLE